MNTISVIGLGKLGTPLLAVLSEALYRVVGVDTNSAKVEAINASKSPVDEPEVQTMLAAMRGKYSATTNVAEAVTATDATFVIVPTPSGDDGGFTLEYLAPVAEQIGAALAGKDSEHLVVITSTVMPGQTAELADIIARISGKARGEGWDICYSPTFIALGSVVKNLINPDYVLIGAESDRAVNLLEGIYLRMAPNAPVVRTNWANAEIAKIAQNAYITMKITFANQLGELCSHIPGANVDDVTQALGHDSRIGSKYLRAGTPYGGPCFPRDNRALAVVAQTQDWPLDTDDDNKYLAGLLAQMIINNMPPTGALGIIGLSYKPGTSSVDESPAINLVSMLLGTFYWSHYKHLITVYDSLALDNARAELGDRVQYAESARACIEAADVVVLMHPDAALVMGAASSDWDGKTLIDPWRVMLEHDGRFTRYIPLGIGPREAVTV